MIRPKIDNAGGLFSLLKIFITLLFVLLGLADTATINNREASGSTAGYLPTPPKSHKGHSGHSTPKSAVKTPSRVMFNLPQTSGISGDDRAPSDFNPGHQPKNRSTKLPANFREDSVSVQSDVTKKSHSQTARNGGQKTGNVKRQNSSKQTGSSQNPNVFSTVSRHDASGSHSKGSLASDSRGNTRGNGSERSFKTQTSSGLLPAGGSENRAVRRAYQTSSEGKTVSAKSNRGPSDITNGSQKSHRGNNNIYNSSQSDEPFLLLALESDVASQRRCPKGAGEPIDSHVRTKQSSEWLGNKSSRSRGKTLVCGAGYNEDSLGANSSSKKGASESSNGRDKILASKSGYPPSMKVASESGRVSSKKEGSVSNGSKHTAGDYLLKQAPCESSQSKLSDASKKGSGVCGSVSSKKEASECVERTGTNGAADESLNTPFEAPFEASLSYNVRSDGRLSNRNMEKSVASQSGDADNAPVACASCDDHEDDPENKPEGEVEAREGFVKCKHCRCGWKRVKKPGSSPFAKFFNGKSQAKK